MGWTGGLEEEGAEVPGLKASSMGARSTLVVVESCTRSWAVEEVRWRFDPRCCDILLLRC